jgi:hypothetical protein
MSGRSPLAGIELLLVDGNNLLHRRRLGIAEAAQRGLLVELQRVLPAGVHAVVVLDGHPAAGVPLRQRVSASLELRHAAGSADEAIVAEVAGLAWAARGRTVVVTDDRALADRSRSAGALTRRLDWLAALPPAPRPPDSTGVPLGARRPKLGRPAARRRG